ncbi:IS30 family transposase, partial [Bifidobacterium bifidum]
PNKDSSPKKPSNTPLPIQTPAGAFAGELLELQDRQGCCTSK